MNLPELQNVPEILTSMPNWVHWKLTPDANGAPGKVPYIAGTGFTRKASSTKSSTWTTFDEATKNITLDNTQGIGFVVHGDAVAAEIVGFDIDGCRNPDTGDITPWAEEIINLLDSYTEITPSQTGVRVWTKGKLTGKDHVFHLDPAVGFGDKVQIEIFDCARYFTVTGDAYYEGAVDVESRDLSKAYELCGQFAKRYPVKKSPELPVEVKVSESSKAEGAKVEQTGSVITTKLEVLMHGQITSEKPFVITDGFGNTIKDYPSHSEADLGLCTELALKHGNNPDLIWEDYTHSSLVRDRWLKRENYFRAHTIATAITTAERISGKHNTAPNETKPETKTDLTVVTPLVYVDGDTFMAEDIPPRRVLLRTRSKSEPVFFQQSINQIFAWRGTGKTNVGLGLTMAFATAGSILNWKVPERSRVLYIEGELPGSQFQERWKAIVGKTGGYAHLVTIDKQPSNVMPKLSTKIGMDKVEATLAAFAAEGRKVDVLMLDSISTLFNVSANDEDVWLSIQDWLISLRSRGLTIIFFHHSGKGGLSRSHSKSEDMLDVSIKLESPENKESGCLHAIMSYDKARAGLDEPPAEIKMHRTHSDDCACHKSSTLVWCPGDGVRWEYKSLEDVAKLEAFQLFRAGMSIGKVAKELGISKSTVQYWKQQWDEAQPVMGGTGDTED